MLLEFYDWGLEARTLQVIAGLILGLLFGAAAQASRFCLRRTVAGDAGERGSAGAVWVTAFAAALIGFALAQSFGLVAVEDHRFQSTSLPLAAIVLGGLAFGIGMVLTRGCVSRLTVLSATGNLRAVFVLLAFAVAAHATLKGVFAPVRTSIGAYTVDAPVGGLADLPFGIATLTAAAVVLAALLILRFRPAVWQLALGCGHRHCRGRRLGSDKCLGVRRVRSPAPSIRGLHPALERQPVLGGCLKRYPRRIRRGFPGRCSGRQLCQRIPSRRVEVAKLHLTR